MPAMLQGRANPGTALAPLAEPEPAAPSEPGASATPAEDLQLARGLEVVKSWTYFERLHQARVEGEIRAAKTP